MTQATIAMNDRQIYLGRHALGLPNRKQLSSRNWYSVHLSHPDYLEWIQMVNKGNAIGFYDSRGTEGYRSFRLTKEGATACLLAREKLSPEDFAGQLTEGDKRKKDRGK
jgi:hypothetical protein